MELPRAIRIETDHAAMLLEVGEDGRLYQNGFGSRGAQPGKPSPAYPQSGDGWIFTPALQVVHADGNTSTDFRVMKVQENGPQTRITLSDPQYDFELEFFVRCYPNLDVFETWTEILHREPGEVQLQRFASSAIDFGDDPCWLTQFHGDWADEVNLLEEKLTYGIKTLDSKLGVRAHQFRAPWFLLSRSGPAQENAGEVFGGSLAWSGSFAFDFEVLPTGRLMAMCGINPFDSAYRLEPGKPFVTPKMIWAWSGNGTGQLSRNLHRWVRANALRDGDSPRAVLLNNWEATYFKFDEAKILSLFDGAAELGMELFLLDDGWFGVKYPRDDDSQGLGDWTPDPKKLPNGLGVLAEGAKERGLRFGIWLEPEMVNPRSELFEAHPRWAISQPKRALDLQRNQLILDLSRPEVKEYVFEVADRVLRENPGITYVKWDCNRYVTQPGSAYLLPHKQSHLWIDYVNALYDIFDCLAKTHPHVQIMMCSGGGGRVDYGALRFAHEYWPSDRTDAVRRVFIQWGFSYFLPAIASAAHVTHMGHRPLKFSFDVAMSGRLGMDMEVDLLPPEDREFTKRAICTYKGIRDIVQLGDLYRLESPYAGTRSSLLYEYAGQAVLFVFSLGESEPAFLELPLPPARYQITELNTDVPAAQHELTGRSVAIPALGEFESRVYLITA